MSKFIFIRAPQHGVSRRNLDHVLADWRRLDVVCRAIYVGYNAEQAFALACSPTRTEEIHGVIAVSDDLRYSEFYDLVDRMTRVVHII